MKNLSRQATQWWRNAAQRPEFTEGLLYLRVTAAQNIKADTEGDLLKSAIAFGGYQQAISDIEDKLTFIPKQERTIDEPPLNS